MQVHQRRYLIEADLLLAEFRLSGVEHSQQLRSGYDRTGRRWLAAGVADSGEQRLDDAEVSRRVAGSGSGARRSAVGDRPRAEAGGMPRAFDRAGPPLLRSGCRGMSRCFCRVGPALVGVAVAAQAAAQVLQYPRLDEHVVGLVVDRAHVLHHGPFEQLEQDDAYPDVDVEARHGGDKGFADHLRAQRVASLYDGRVLRQMIQSLGDFHDGQGKLAGDLRDDAADGNRNLQLVVVQQLDFFWVAVLGVSRPVLRPGEQAVESPVDLVDEGFLNGLPMQADLTHRVEVQMMVQIVV